jgi:hypothetical protein
MLISYSCHPLRTTVPRGDQGGFAYSILRAVPLGSTSASTAATRCAEDCMHTLRGGIEVIDRLQDLLLPNNRQIVMLGKATTCIPRRHEDYGSLPNHSDAVYLVHNQSVSVPDPK